MSISSNPKYNIDLRHDFIQILSEKLSEDQVQALVEDLEMLKFNCDVRRSEEETKEWQLLIGLNDQERILREAEANYVMVPREYENKDKQQAQTSKKDRQQSYLPKLVIETEKKKAFTYEHRNEYRGGDFDKILCESEKSRLIYIILDKIKLSQMPEFVKAMKDTKEYTVLEGANEALQYYLKRNQIMKEMIPLWSKSNLIRAGHEGIEDPTDSALSKQVKDPLSLYVDVQKIREHYGDDCAIYFEWMNYFQQWLLIPSGLAILVYFSVQYVWDIHTSPAAGIFSIVMSLWGTIFLVSWRRHCRGLDIIWDDYVMQDDAEDLRKEFIGEPCINPVTDLPDTYFPANKRLVEYFKSFWICFPCWCVCCLIIVIFLNATGVIRPHHHGGYFDMPSVSKLADEGEIFDPNFNMNMVVSIGQAIMTIIMNVYFRKIAHWTADMENHKTQKAYNNSVFIKRFIFEFTDFQLYLFYIGIYQLDIQMLRVNLVSVFMVDQIRRILLEMVVPYVCKNKDKISKDVQDKIKKAKTMVKKKDSAKVEEASSEQTSTSAMSRKEILDDIVEEELAELELEEVETFDDYLEMIMTFGYITLFASAFPIGTTITSLFIYLETKSDMFKFERTARRPFSKKCHDIGTWEIALDILTIMSVFTNIVLCCYASDQIDYILPWLKGMKEDSSTNMLTIFGIEHVMVFLVGLLRVTLNTEPRWLRIFRERRAFKSVKRQERVGLIKSKAE